MQEERLAEQNKNKEFKHQFMKHALGTVKFSKWIILIPIVIFVVVFTIIVFGFISINKDINSETDDAKNEVESFFESISDEINSVEKIEEEKEIFVNFNEYGATTKYKVKVTNYEFVEDKFNRLPEDYEYVKFYLQVENLTNDEIQKEDVNCIVDGVAQTNDFTSGYSDLPHFIKKRLTVKGTATFEVPKSAGSNDIKYGDYITIHIER